MLAVAILRAKLIRNRAPESHLLRCMSWYDSEYKFYEGIACLYGPNGGDIPVFDAGPAATVTKLKFDAGTEATKLAAVAHSASPTSTVAVGPELTPAPMCKAVIRASHWRANDEFREGQELPEQLQLSGLDMDFRKKFRVSRTSH